MRVLLALIFILFDIQEPVFAQQKPNAVENILFDVFLDKKKVGTHDFVVEYIDKEIWIESNMQLKGKFWGLVPFKYSHQSSEHWVNGCLVNLKSQTLKRGKSINIKAISGPSGLNIVGPSKSQVVKGCVKSFAYWDGSLLKCDKLLNTEDGELVNVEIQKIQAQGVEGESVVIRSSEVDINLYYDADGKWLSLKSNLDVGGLLHYIRQP